MAAIKEILCLTAARSHIESLASATNRKAVVPSADIQCGGKERASGSYRHEHFFYGRYIYRKVRISTALRPITRLKSCDQAISIAWCHFLQRKWDHWPPETHTVGINSVCLWRSVVVLHSNEGQWLFLFSSPLIWFLLCWVHTIGKRQQSCTRTQH